MPSNSYHAGCSPELSCHSLMLCRSPREKCVVSSIMSTPPLSNTGFSWSVRWWGSLSPSVPNTVIVTWDRKGQSRRGENIVVVNVVQQKHQRDFVYVTPPQVSTDTTDLRGGGCTMPMSGADTQHITILGQGVVVLKHCYLDLHVNVKTQHAEIKVYIHYLLRKYSVVHISSFNAQIGPIESESDQMICWSINSIICGNTSLRVTLAESWMSFLRAHTTTRRYAEKMAPTKHTTTGLSVNVAKSSAVRDTSTKFGMTKKELPNKVKWLQRHWVTKGVVSGPTCGEKKTEKQPIKLHSSLLNDALLRVLVLHSPCSRLHPKKSPTHSSICTEQRWKPR